MFKEFKEFAIKGNAMDLAVGLVIGAAFTAIVNSLVKDIMMPLVGALLGSVDFVNRFFVLREGLPAGPYATLEAATKAGAVTLNYGAFVNAVVTFVIVAFVLFLIVKAMNRLRREPAPEPNTKECPYCKSEIALAATKCPACTSEV
ncbi:MAG: large conductance mechanosensitive channel protein MscL [Actinobacteria bacterium HGW-Actinobacteria-1]|jgi:large conductance mechanosensitive channel|nr:MAG: large conductance mechanosensitive channel protein MscL [Actinobacteria bacterium HGW-Actinobacteria-1]